MLSNLIRTDSFPYLLCALQAPTWICPSCGVKTIKDLGNALKCSHVPPQFLEEGQAAERRGSSHHSHSSGMANGNDSRGFATEDEGFGLRWFKWCQGVQVETVNEERQMVEVVGPGEPGREVGMGQWDGGGRGQGFRSVEGERGGCGAPNDMVSYNYV